MRTMIVRIPRQSGQGPASDPPEQREVHRVGAVAMRSELDVWPGTQVRQGGQQRPGVQLLDTGPAAEHVGDDRPGLGQVR